MAYAGTLKKNIAASSSCSQEELLRYILERDNLSLDGVVSDYMKVRKEQILANHPYTIFQSKDGRYRTYIKDPSMSSGRRMIAKSSREKLEDAIVEQYNAMSEDLISANTTLASLYPDWIEYKALHVEYTTINRVKKDWKRYYEDAAIVSKPICSISKLDLDEWIHRMIKKYDMDYHQYGNFSLILRQELDYAVDRGIIDSNPFLSVRIDKKRVLRAEHKKADETQVFTPEELEFIYRCAEKDFLANSRPKHKLVPLAVQFLFQTGLRLCEIASLRYEDIDDDEIIVRRMVRYPGGEIIDSTKGTFGDRRVPLTPKALELIDIARKKQKDNGQEDMQYIFVMAGGPIHLYLAIQKAFAKYCKQLDIQQRGPHKARKTYISELLDSGININTVRSVAGHKDEHTTFNNYCYDRKTKTERNAQIIAAIQ